jgi:hypothetical protein
MEEIDPNAEISYKIGVMMPIPALSRKVSSHHEFGTRDNFDLR